MILLKSFALNNRLKEKDAWDIYYCLKHNPEGMDQIVHDFQLIKKHALVQEAIIILGEKFSSPTAVGPTHVAHFEDVTDSAEQDLIQRDAYV